jgi:glycosyltransferase involved in cell wall biosynthesis
MISVVLRAKNERAWIGRCLTAIRRQRLPHIDVILVDNDSTDGTVEVAAAHGATLTNITREEFSYGRALNIGIEAAKHEVVTLLSSHCVPVDELWADYAYAHLGPEGDTKVCGIYGRQEPMPDTSAIDLAGRTVRREDPWRRGSRVGQAHDCRRLRHRLRARDARLPPARYPPGPR